MKGLVADLALERLLARVGQAMVLVVALLMEALAAELAHPRPVAGVDAHVRVQRRAAVEGLAASAALVRFFVRVDDLHQVAIVYRLLRHTHQEQGTFLSSSVRQNAESDDLCLLEIFANLDIPNQLGIVIIDTLCFHLHITSLE